MEMKAEIKDRIMSHEKPVVSALYNSVYNQVSVVHFEYTPGAWFFEPVYNTICTTVIYSCMMSVSPVHVDDTLVNVLSACAVKYKAEIWCTS